MNQPINSHIDLTGEISTYISDSWKMDLPAEVVTRAKHHILDTLAAMVSGSKLKPGQAAMKYAEHQSGAAEAQLICSPTVTSAINAAMANGMMAHADETDDFVPSLHFHPGAVIVPAALAVSEKAGIDGMSFLKGVVTGYDIGCRILRTLGPETLWKIGRDSHCMGGTLGAASAASSVLRLDEYRVRYVLSYAAEQVSGLNYWHRDTEHIEKAFLLAGLPARNGVTAAILVESGFTGIRDPFSGHNNFFETVSPGSRSELMVEALGIRYDIMSAYMKKFPVGGPIQAGLDALITLMDKHQFKSGDVQNLTIYQPHVGVVDNPDMPDINLQHLLAVTLLDGNLTFEMAHSYERMRDPAVIEIKNRIRVVENAGFFADGVLRQAIIELVLKDGTLLREHVINWRGRAENPMTSEEVAKKCRDLMAPVLGQGCTQKLIDKVLNLEQVRNMQEFRPLLSA